MLDSNGMPNSSKNVSISITTFQVALILHPIPHSDVLRTALQLLLDGEIKDYTEGLITKVVRKLASEVVIETCVIYWMER